MLTTVLIDVDDTLLDFQACARSSMCRTLTDHGVAFREEWFAVFTEENDKLWLAVEAGELSVPQLYEIRWNVIFRRLGLPLDGVGFERSFLRYLHESAVPVEGAVELMAYLHARYTVCIASNAPHDQQLTRWLVCWR